MHSLQIHVYSGVAVAPAPAGDGNVMAEGAADSEWGDLGTPAEEAAGFCAVDVAAASRFAFDGQPAAVDSEAGAEVGEENVAVPNGEAGLMFEEGRRLLGSAKTGSEAAKGVTALNVKGGEIPARFSITIRGERLPAGAAAVAGAVDAVHTLRLPAPALVVAAKAVALDRNGFVLAAGTCGGVVGEPSEKEDDAITPAADFTLLPVFTAVKAEANVPTDATVSVPRRKGLWLLGGTVATLPAAVVAVVV